MAIEITKTGGERIPNARYLFEVSGKPEKIILTRGGTQRKWIFKVMSLEEKNGVRDLIQDGLQIYLAPWKSKDLLLAVGGELVPGTVDDIEWDDEQVDGKWFSANIKTVEYTNKNGETKQGYELSKIEAEVPF